MSSSESQDRGHLRADSVAAKDAESLLGARRAEKNVVATEQGQTESSINEHELVDEQVIEDKETNQVDDPEVSTEPRESVLEREPVEDASETVAESVAHSEDTIASNESREQVATASTTDVVDARTKAMEDKPRLLKLRATVIALAVPLAIFGLAARLVSSTVFLWIEYHRPGFPADDYGFSTDDRMLYGSYGVNYILNFAPSTYLSELRVESKTKLFLQTEVDHMTDVKHVMIAGMILATVIVLLALLSSKSLPYRSPGTIRKSLFVGSLLALVLMVALGVLAGLGWDSFFTNFHHVLFPQGNWEFRMSDSLIRLYPPQFWVDAGIAFAVLAVLFVALMLVATWPGKNRRARAKLLRDFRDEQRKLLQGK